MKKIIITFVSIIMVFCFFTACDSKTSKNNVNTESTSEILYEHSDKGIAVVNDVISYAEQYLNGEIDFQDAKSEIIQIQIDFFKENEEDQEADTYLGDLEICVEISEFNVIFTSDAIPSEIKEGINTLKNLIK